MSLLVSPRTLLRLEGAAIFVLSAGLYATTDASWWLFAAVLLVPDVAIAAYLGGPRLGAAVYNAVHVYALPAMLGGAGLLIAAPLAVSLALIWTTHIGLDRALGYGLKEPSGFHDTHLGSIVGH